MKVLTIFLILTIGSLTGCAATPPYAPLCTPDRPNLESISVPEQQQIEPEVLRKLASNDLRLKSHIKTLEDLIKAHNELYGVECDT